MLKRTISDKLSVWKSRDHHPLVLSGMRQTGKTYIVRQFGRENYDSVVYLDLRANHAAHDAFSGEFDVNQMVLSLTAANSGARFVPGKTLLILDEVQDCPNARSSLKYWDIDGRYDVIATGSFLGVKGFREPYPRGVPVGYEEHLTMHPLTFREFLLNYGVGQDVFAHVEASLEAVTPVLKAVHESLRALYLQYLIVGGMPEAVSIFPRSTARSKRASSFRASPPLPRAPSRCTRAWFRFSPASTAPPSRWACSPAPSRSPRA